jgi:hypothetical protein
MERILKQFFAYVQNASLLVDIYFDLPTTCDELFIYSVSIHVPKCLTSKVK